MRRTLKAGTSTEQGFSLVELIVALSIIGIVTASLAPRLLAADHLRHTARSLSGSIRHAYVQAIAQRRTQRLCVNLGQAEYWISTTTCEFVPTAENLSPPPHMRLAPGVRFVDMETGRQGAVRRGQPEILFYPIGLTERNIIHLEDSSHRRLSLVIHPLTGRVSSYEGELPEHAFEDQGPHAPY